MPTRQTIIHCIAYLLTCFPLFFVNQQALGHAGNKNDVVDYTFGISGDFGPRTVDNKFHIGMDYGVGLGTPVPPLENGRVSAITHNTNNGLVTVRIKGDNGHDFRYLHLFRDSTVRPVCTGGFVLVNDGGLAIVRLASGHNDRARYILATSVRPSVSVSPPVDPSDPTKFLPYPAETGCQGVLPPMRITFKNSGGTANRSTRTTVVRGSHLVGPSGNSGNNATDPAATHLHVELFDAGGNGTSENPYFHIADRASDFKLRILDKNLLPRLSGYVVGPNNADSTFLKVEVDSSTGFDLEKFNIYVDNAVPANLVREYSYGGTTPAHDPVNADTSTGGGDLSDGLTNGIQPIQRGLERFVYNDWESANTTVSPSNLIDGEHTLRFELEDIDGNIPFASGVQPSLIFNVDKRPPTSSLAVKDTL